MIRLGIIGIGNMGSGHARSILNGACPDFELAAVADISKPRLAWFRENLSVNPAFFTDADTDISASRHSDFIRLAPPCARYISKTW